MSMLTVLVLSSVLGASGGPPYYQRPATPEADLAALKQQMATQSGDERYWLQRVALYVEMGELEDIGPLLESLTRSFPRQPVFREAWMMLQSRQGHHEQALGLGLSILAEFPGYPTIRVNLARVYEAKGDLVGALNLMIGAIEAGPVRVEDWDFLLRTLAQSDHDAGRTLERLKRKVEEHPEIQGLKYLQVVLYTRFGDYLAARNILKAQPALARHPDLQRFVAEVDAALAATETSP